MSQCDGEGKIGWEISYAYLKNLGACNSEIA